MAQRISAEICLVPRLRGRPNICWSHGPLGELRKWSTELHWLAKELLCCVQFGQSSSTWLANLGRDLLGTETQRLAEHLLKSWTTRWAEEVVYRRYIDWLKSYYVVYSSAEAVAHGPVNLGQDLLGTEIQRSAEHLLKPWTTRWAKEVVYRSYIDRPKSYYIVYSSAEAVGVQHLIDGLAEESIFAHAQLRRIWVLSTQLG